MVAMKVAGLFPDTRQISREDILRTYDSLFDWRGGTMSVILLGSLLAFIILAWEKASGLSAEDRKEIGILKAVGWETSDVLFMKFWERIALSLMSFFAGITPGVFPRFLCIIVHSRTGHERLGRSLSPF